MATITLKGSPIHTVGDLPSVGSIAPDFTLTDGALQDVELASFAGQKKILSMVPSLDTGVCAQSAERFNQEVAGLDGVTCINISADLPFAAGRVCESRNIKNVVTLSTFRSPEFGRTYGVEIVDGPMAGLLSRAVVVTDEENKILHTQQVPEIGEEPDYDAVLAALQ